MTQRRPTKQRPAIAVHRINFSLPIQAYEDFQQLAIETDGSMTRLLLRLIAEEVRRTGREPTWAK